MKDGSCFNTLDFVIAHPGGIIAREETRLSAGQPPQYDGDTLDELRRWADFLTWHDGLQGFFREAAIVDAELEALCRPPQPRQDERQALMAQILQLQNRLAAMPA